VPAVIGYSAVSSTSFGCPPVNILLAVHSMLASALKLLTASVAIFSLPVKMFPAVQEVESALIAQSKAATCARNGVRTALSLASLVLALAVPDFGFLVSFVGAFCMGLIAFALPPVMYLSLARKRGALGPAAFGAHVCLAAAGVAMTVGATGKVVLDKLHRVG